MVKGRLSKAKKPLLKFGSFYGWSFTAHFFSDQFQDSDAPREINDNTMAGRGDNTRDSEDHPEIWMNFGNSVPSGKPSTVTATTVPAKTKIQK